MKDERMHLFELIKSYLTVYLPKQRKSSVNTCKSYREAINLLLEFLCSHLGKPLGEIVLDDITVANIQLFVQWLEVERKCHGTTQNQRMSAIKAFLKYCGMKGSIIFSM